MCNGCVGSAADSVGMICPVRTVCMNMPNVQIADFTQATMPACANACRCIVPKLQQLLLKHLQFAPRIDSCCMHTPGAKGIAVPT